MYVMCGPILYPQPEKKTKAFSLFKFQVQTEVRKEHGKKEEGCLHDFICITVELSSFCVLLRFF